VLSGTVTRSAGGNVFSAGEDERVERGSLAGALSTGGLAPVPIGVFAERVCSGDGVIGRSSDGIRPIRIGLPSGVVLSRSFGR
jgi:hypothetical protein